MSRPVGVEDLFLEGFNAFAAVVTTYCSVYFARTAIAMNGGVGGIPAMLSASFGRFFGGHQTTWQDAAIALSGVFGAEALRCWTIWVWRHFDGRLLIPILVVGLFVLSTTAMCILRVFAPHDKPGRRRWIVIFGIAAVFAFTSVLTR